MTLGHFPLPTSTIHSCNCLRACTPAGRRGSICRTAHLGALWTACTSVSPVRTAGMVQRVPPRPAYGATAVPLLGEQADTVAADGKTCWPRTAVVLATLVTIGYLAITRLQTSASAQSVLTGGLASHAQLPSVHARYSASGPSVHAKAADLAKPTCTNAPPKEWQPWRALNLTMTNVHPNFGRRKKRPCVCSPSNKAGRTSRNSSSAQAALPAQRPRLLSSPTYYRAAIALGTRAGGGGCCSCLFAA